jgi:hypothetical protein
VAAQGLVWQLPGPEGSPLRVMAAQLQHRVPCWGYVLQVKHTSHCWTWLLVCASSPCGDS